VSDSESQTNTNANVLTLADGTKIDKATGSVVKDTIEQPELLDENIPEVEAKEDDDTDEEEIAAIKERIPVNRYMSDLPGDVNSTRAIAVIASLTLFGLSAREVSYICNTETDKVEAIKQSERYGDFTTNIIDNVMRAQSDNVRAMFVNNARPAAEHIISGLKSKIPEVRHMAAKEVLDRGGFRPVDVVEHRVRHENELKIVHIRGDAEKSVTIDADYEEAM
jgi:hypothetical protein